MIAKRDDWRSKEDETPEQERERLLQQVKQDNQEIASLEKRYHHRYNHHSITARTLYYIALYVLLNYSLDNKLIK